MMENNFTYKAKVISISEIEHFERTTKPDIFKRRLFLQLDENNSFYAEIRNNFIAKLSHEGIQTDSDVVVTVEFEANNKDGKHYNNILIKDIKLYNEQVYK